MDECEVGHPQKYVGGLKNPFSQNAGGWGLFEGFFGVEFDTALNLWLALHMVNNEREPVAEERYPKEELNTEWEEDDGTIVENVETLAEHVVGRKIVAVEKGVEVPSKYDWCGPEVGTALVLDNGKKVVLVDTDDCCAYTELRDVILNLDKIGHVIMGVGTTDGYRTWHIYADLGDVAELKVGWSSGYPFYYGYGFNITVLDASDKAVDTAGDSK